jgi:hypothetical protein
VTGPKIEQIAELLRERNAIDEKVAKIISRPMTAGNLGEWLAARIFGIELEPTAVTAAFDGRFTSGHLRGRTVNVKWYLKREGVLDMTKSETLDYYLVLTGPTSAALSSRGRAPGWRPGEPPEQVPAGQPLGDIGDRSPMDRSTWRVAASSSSRRARSAPSPKCCQEVDLGREPMTKDRLATCDRDHHAVGRRSSRAASVAKRTVPRVTVARAVL